MGLIKKYRLLIIFAIAGAIGGLLYWKFIGCQSGTCPIKSVWYWSILYGALLGLLVGSIINDVVIRFRKKKDSSQNQPIE
jgi:fructose-specific phosphotransferase system IIC component